MPLLRPDDEVRVTKNNFLNARASSPISYNVSQKSLMAAQGATP